MTTNTQPKHTPAPWIQDGVNVTIPSGEYRVAKCLMDNNGALQDEAEANELLEALENALIWWQNL